MKILDLHPVTWARLRAALNRLPHALLFAGQRGIGKFELARAFAAALLCEQPLPSGEACAACVACNWLAQGNHPDFRLVQPEALADGDGEVADVDGGGGGKKKPSQQITIDQVRALEEFLHVGTHRQGFRVLLLHPAEAMNRATANSLLKPLEEPIPGTIFILVSSEPERLLPTIRSRCRLVPLSLPARESSQRWLKEAGQLKSDEDAARWLDLAGGAPLLAAELAGGDERGLLDALLGELQLGPRLDPLAAAARLDKQMKSEKRPVPLKRLVEWSQKWLFDLLLAGNDLPAHYFGAQAVQLTKLAGAACVVDVAAFGRKALQYRLMCEQPLNSRLFLEDFFLAYAALFRISQGGKGDKHDRSD